MAPDTTVNIYPLTEDETTSANVLQDVASRLNGESVNPMTDKIVVSSPVKVNKEITLNVQLCKDADYDSVSSQINSTVTEYKDTMRKSLNTEIIPSQIIAKIGSIEGVYSVDTGDLTTCTAAINEYYDIAFIVNITQ